MAKIELFDITGNVVLSDKKSVEKGVSNVQISGENITDRVLIYQVSVDGKIYTGRIIKVD